MQNISLKASPCDQGCFDVKVRFFSFELESINPLSLLVIYHFLYHYNELSFSWEGVCTHVICLISLFFFCLDCMPEKRKASEKIGHETG
jgi:hypothetical protein